MKPIIVIAGQTSSGKSKLALELAKKINGYIINGDSRQIYTQLKIGTSQPVADKVVRDGHWEIDGISHHLYGFIDIEDQYNIFKYQKDVKRVLESEDTEKVPILIGGTGLYIDSVIFNYDLNKKAKGEPLNHIYFVLDVEKEIINERIKESVEWMFKNGLLEENEELWEKYSGYDLKALKSIGYYEFKEFFEKKITIDDVKENIIIHTRQYAKRQRTWFRRNKEVVKIKSIREVVSHLKLYTLYD